MRKRPVCRTELVVERCVILLSLVAGAALQPRLRRYVTADVTKVLRLAGVAASSKAPVAEP